RRSSRSSRRSSRARSPERGDHEGGELRTPKTRAHRDVSSRRCRSGALRREYARSERVELRNSAEFVALAEPPLGPPINSVSIVASADRVVQSVAALTRKKSSRKKHERIDHFENSDLTER